MGNLINNIITLGNDEKFIVLNQAVYQEKNYFLVAKVTEDEQDVLDEFTLLEEVKIDNESCVQVVKDEKMIELLTKYFNPNR